MLWPSARARSSPLRLAAWSLLGVCQWQGWRGRGTCDCLARPQEIPPIRAISIASVVPKRRAFALQGAQSLNPHWDGSRVEQELVLILFQPVLSATGAAAPGTDPDLDASLPAEGERDFLSARSRFFSSFFAFLAAALAAAAAGSGVGAGGPGTAGGEGGPLPGVPVWHIGSGQHTDMRHKSANSSKVSVPPKRQACLPLFLSPWALDSDYADASEQHTPASRRGTSSLRQ